MPKTLSLINSLRNILGKREFDHEPTEAARVLNEIIGLRNIGQNYLEIGVEFGLTLLSVKSSKKMGVDPEPKIHPKLNDRITKLFVGTSDAFFKSKYNCPPYDLVYLDGLHTFEQTYSDLKNAFSNSTSNAVILIDDTVPTDSYSTNPNGLEAYRSREEAGIKNTGAWHGDVYKVVIALSRLNVPNLEIRTIINLSNPKTALFLKHGAKWPDIPNLVDLSSFSEETYEKIFLPNISEQFFPVTLEEFLEDLSKK